MIRQTVAALYHQQTKYHPTTIAQGHFWDQENPPPQFKEYAGAERVELKPFLPTEDHPTWQAEAALRDPNGTFGLPALSRLLFATNGVTAIAVMGGVQQMYFRAAPSAGALYPTDLYLLVRNHADISDGVYYYHVRDHALIEVYPKGLAPSGNQLFQRLSKACFNDALTGECEMALVATAVFWRSQWRYGDRAYRRCLLDTGHVLGNFDIVAPRLGIGVAAVGGFVDSEVAELLAIPEDKEGVLGVFPLFDPAGAHKPGPSARSGPPDDGRMEKDAILGIHNAGAIRRDDVAKLSGVAGNDGAEPFLVNPKYEFAEGVKLRPSGQDLNEQIELAILRRRSTRTLNAQPLSLAELSDLLAYGYRPDLNLPSEQHPRYFDTGLIETFVVVNDVNGLDPGVYYFAPGFMELLKVRQRDVRREIQHLSLGQELARDASAVVIHTADLEAATERYGTRAYRYLHLDAGHIGERLNVAAIKMGLGVSGIGGFFDDEVNELLGIPEKELCVYITCLGKPAE